MLSNHYSSKMTLQQDELYAPVNIVPMTSLTGLPSRRGLENAVVSNGKVVNVVSRTYGLITNEQYLLEMERNMVDAGFEYKLRTINRDDRQFAMDIILDDPNCKIEVKSNSNDIIVPMLRFTNSYDGSLRASGSYGFFRKVCSNGLHIANTKFAFHLKHHTKAMGIIQPTLKNIVKQFIDNEFYTVRRKFEVMWDCKVDKLQDAVRDICHRTKVFQYEASATNLSPSANAHRVMEIATAEAVELNTDMNQWIVYNAFNNFVHNHTKKSLGGQASYDRHVFESMTSNIHLS